MKKSIKFIIKKSFNFFFQEFYYDYLIFLIYYYKINIWELIPPYYVHNLLHVICSLETSFFILDELKVNLFFQNTSLIYNNLNIHLVLVDRKLLYFLIFLDVFI